MREILENVMAGKDVNCGKFQDIYTEFLKRLSENDFDKFKELKFDEERIKFVFGLKCLQDFVLQDLQNSVITNFKSAESAKRLKEDGNRAFQANQFKVALELYSKCIMNQPQTTASDMEELSVMFANRSAALYHLQEYEAALEDIQSSSDYNYPSHLQYKICERKARCFLALNYLKSAKESFRKTIQALDEAKLSGERRQKLQRDVQIMLAMLDKNKELKDASKKHSSGKVEIKQGTNKQYPDISKVIAIKVSPEMGRFAEAKEDIQPGDILLKEKPHCAVLLDQFSKTNCFQCFSRAMVVYPCPRCSLVLFCSVSCRAAALASHHRVECAVLPALWQSGASVTCLMSLRVISQHPLEHFLQLRPTLQSTSRDKPYKSSDYLRMYDLVSHSDKRSPEDFLQRTVMAIYLLRYLQMTDYFKKQDKNKVPSSKECLSVLTEYELFIGSLLLRHLQSLQFNSHEVSELIIKGKDKQSLFIGGAVYPSLALFNHSCNPGIVRYHRGTEVIVRAIRTIRSGEMVAENYGPIFLQVPRSERQQTLRSQYWFECECEPCVCDWPLLANMSSDVMRFRCDCGSIVLVPVDTPEFMVPCRSCKQHVNIFKGLKVLQDTDTLFRVAKSLVDEGHNMTALNKFLELLTLLDSTLVPPFRDYHLCQQEIRTCMLACGNVNKIK